MEPSPAPNTPLDVNTLTDEELFKILPLKQKKQTASKEEKEGKAAQSEEIIAEQEHEIVQLQPQEKQALDELWLRHYESVKRNLRVAIFAGGSTLCPSEEPDKRHFLLMCLNEAYPAFLRRTGRDEYENFGGYLYTLVLHVALDVRKQLTKIRNDEKDAPKGGKKPRTKVQMVRGANLDETLVDEGRNPPEFVAAREAQELVRSVLEEHARESPRNSASTKVLRHRRADELGWSEIAEKLLPSEVFHYTLETKIEALRKLDKPDVRDVLRILLERGVTSSRAFKI